MKSKVELDEIVRALREAHRELHAPLTIRSITRVLARERIARRPGRLPVAAMTVIQYGRAAIVIDPDRVRDPRQETAVLAEEYAHAKLHAGDPGEVTIHLSAASGHDPREYEADYVARCLLAGPDVEVTYFAPRPPRIQRPAAFAFGHLDPYQGAPWGVTRQRRQPRYGGQAGETPLQRARRLARPLPRPMRSGEPSDAGIILRERDGRVYFVDVDGMRWRIHDVAYMPERMTVDTGRAVARVRTFVNANAVQRRYQFARWELRDVTPAHCERQLRDATQVPTQKRDAAQRTAG